MIRSRERPTDAGIVPILCYHAIGDDLPDDELPFAFSPSTFARHLDLIAARGMHTMTVADVVAARARGEGAALDGAVAITFDDGYADLLHTVQSLLAERRMVATAFVTTGYVDARTRGDRDADRWLRWDELRELAGTGTFEIGAHSHEHVDLDVLDHERAIEQVRHSHDALASEGGVDATSFAFPYGYSNAALRAALPSAGFTAACSVKHALSTAADDPLDLARVRVLRRHDDVTVGRWIAGENLRLAPCAAELRTRVFGVVRHARHRINTIRTARSSPSH